MPGAPRSCTLNVQDFENYPELELIYPWMAGPRFTGGIR